MGDVKLSGLGRAVEDLVLERDRYFAENEVMRALLSRVYVFLDEYGATEATKAPFKPYFDVDQIVKS